MPNDRRPPQPIPASYIPLRGASGRLYGYIDPQRLVVEFKHGGRVAEQIDLKPLITPEKRS